MDLELEIAATSTTTQCVWMSVPVHLWVALAVSVCVQREKLATTVNLVSH